MALTVNATLRTKNARLEHENHVKQNNIEAYVGIVNGLSSENRVLILQMDAIKDAHDDMLNKIDSISKVVDVKLDKAIVAASTSQTVEIHTKDTVTVNTDNSFTKVIQPNDLTKIEIVFDGKDSLSHKLDIKNSQFLYVEEKKVYKNKNKKWFKRLITFDWKKVPVYDYTIHNTNPLIKVDSTRVIINKDYVKK